MKRSLIPTILALVLSGCASSSLEDKLQDMTLEDKVQLITNSSSPSSAGIPSIYGSSEHRVMSGTAFPGAPLLASTWNVQAARELGEALGNEALLNGLDYLLMPSANINRNPLSGRNRELFSEDPVLTGKLAAAMTRGIQSQGVGSALKHFVLYGQELNHNGITVVANERSLREIYLRAFEIAVKEGQPWAVVTAANRVNNELPSESQRLTGRILKGDWGFSGAVLTDAEEEGSAVAKISAGTDRILNGNSNNAYEIINAVRSGNMHESLVDNSARGVLRLIGKTPKGRGFIASDVPDLDAHAALSRRIIPEGIVLLENRNGALPLNHPRDIAIFNSNADRPYASIAGGLLEAGCRVNSPLEQLPKADELARIARLNDLAIISFDRNGKSGADRYAGEGDYLLSMDERRLLEAVCTSFQSQNKRVIVVLTGGNILEMADWSHLPDAILLAWDGGQESGKAISDVIMGKAYPSGKLPVSIAERYRDIPSSKNFGLSMGYMNGVKYKEDLMVGYRFFGNSSSNEPSYAFGFGLSYTDFSYSAFKFDKPTKEGDPVVTLKITNTGERPGKEIAQIYVEKPGNEAERPSMELVAFAKTDELQAGESQILSIPISRELLKQWTDRGWELIPGTYLLHACAASDDIRRTLKYTAAAE